MSASVEQMREALAELVACKDLKDRNERHNPHTDSFEELQERRAEYERRQPLAWRRARAALSAPAATEAPPEQPAAVTEDFCGVQQECSERQTYAGTKYSVCKWTCPNCQRACSVLYIDDEWCHGDNLCISFVNGGRAIQCGKCWLDEQPAAQERAEPSFETDPDVKLAEQHGAKVYSREGEVVFFRYNFHQFVAAVRAEERPLPPKPRPKMDPTGAWFYNEEHLTEWGRACFDAGRIAALSQSQAEAPPVVTPPEHWHDPDTGRTVEKPAPIVVTLPLPVAGYAKWDCEGRALVAAQAPASPSLSDAETIATLVYDAMAFEQPKWVPWVPRGNSDAQEHARRAARAIVTAAGVRP